MPGRISHNRYGFFNLASVPTQTPAHKATSSHKPHTPHEANPKAVASVQKISKPSPKRSVTNLRTKTSQQQKAHLNEALKQANNNMLEVDNILDALHIKRRYQGSLKLLRKRQHRIIMRYYRKLLAKLREKKRRFRLLLGTVEEKPKKKTKIFRLKKPGHTNLFANDDYYTMDLFAPPSISMQLMQTQNIYGAILFTVSDKTSHE